VAKNHKKITRGTSTQREQEVRNMSANGNIPNGDDDGGAVDELDCTNGIAAGNYILRSSFHIFDGCDARKAMHKIP
jgi:hypothetical protein